MNNGEQGELNFYFWIGDGGDSISVTEEEFNELFEAKRKLQNDYKNVYYAPSEDTSDEIAMYKAELGYN